MPKRFIFLFIAVCVFIPLYGMPQVESPVLFIHPRQLLTSGNALEGMRVKMEVAFFYRSSIQYDSLYQKCTVEGKFRETGRKIDEVVLYNVLIPQNEFVHKFEMFSQGSRLTLTGFVRKANKAWSEIIVGEISPGWLSDSSRTGNAESGSSPDSVNGGAVY